MRGQRSLFDDLLTIPEIQNPEGKGRNPELIRKRDNIIIARYYFLVFISGMKYFDAMDKLSEEFHLSAIRIQRLLKPRTDEIKKYAENKTTSRELGKKYPWLVW